MEAVDESSDEHGTEREFFVEEREGQSAIEGGEADSKGEGWDVESWEEEAERLQEFARLGDPELGVFHERCVDWAEAASFGNG